MKTQTVFKLSAAGAALFTLYGNPALATEESGVYCPSGYSVERSAGNTNLKCSKTYVRASICPPTSYPFHTQMIDAPGKDRCKNPLLPFPIVPSVMAPPPPSYPPVSAFTRDINGGPGYRDRFVAKVYVFPNGKAYSSNHDPKKGVSCPVNNHGDSVSDGIRCFDTTRIGSASCPSGFKLDINGGSSNKDVCKNGNITRPTIPDGMTQSQFDADKARDDVSWELIVNPNRDSWKRKLYKYPESSL